MSVELTHSVEHDRRVLLSELLRKYVQVCEREGSFDDFRHGELRGLLFAIRLVGYSGSMSIAEVNQEIEKSV